MATTLRDRQRALRDALILDTAYDLLIAHGYAGMSMDELAARAGIAKMTLYNHFPSKEAVAVGVIVRGMALVEADLQAVVEAPLPAIERLREALTRGLTRRATLMDAKLGHGLNLLNQPDYQARSARFATIWTTLIEQAKTEGAIAPSLSTAVLVRLVESIFQNDYEGLISAGVPTSEIVQTMLTVLIQGMKLSTDNDVDSTNGVVTRVQA